MFKLSFPTRTYLPDSGTYVEWNIQELKNSISEKYNISGCIRLQKLWNIPTYTL